MKFAPPLPDEYGLIYDAWSNSYRKSPWAGTIPNNLYDQVSRATASEILSRGARVVMAVEEVPGGRRAIGYSVSEPAKGVLHWLYVKRDYRGLGLGKALLAETLQPFPADVRWVYTHRTKASAHFLRDVRIDWDPVPARVK